MPDFQYVYILFSECGEHHYVGCTADLQQRLNKHNNGDVSHTSKFVRGAYKLLSHLETSKKRLHLSAI